MRVRERRIALKLSQQALAERAGVHWTYVSGVERGQRNPGLNVLGDLAEALDISLASLVDGLQPVQKSRQNRRTLATGAARRKT